MKYSIENNGSGVCMIRVSVPESLAAAFLAFIDQKSRENHAIIEKPSSVKNEKYFIELSTNALSIFEQCLTAGMSSSASISEVTKKLKVLGFNNMSYDIVKTLLTRQGCFKRKSV